MTVAAPRARADGFPVVGVLAGAAVAAWPAVLEMFPFGSEPLKGDARLLGLAFVAASILQAALAVTWLLHLLPNPRRAAFALTAVMATVALGIAIVAAVGEFRVGAAQLSMPFVLGGPLIALSGEALALASFFIRPTVAAAVIGDAWLIAGLFWPANPSGGPALFGEGGPWPLPWLLVGLFATRVVLRGGAQPLGALLALFMLANVFAYPLTAGWNFGNGGPDLQPRDTLWLARTDEAGAVLIGSAWIAAAAGLAGWRRATRQIVVR